MSIPLKPTDPAYPMLMDPTIFSVPKIHREGCYICEDPEFAQLGMPLCNPCPQCEGGHVPADDEDCDDCGGSLREWTESINL